MPDLPKEVEALVKVLSRNQTREYLNLSERTWQRMEAAGDVPTKTQLSEGRVGHRICHIIEWLEARRVVGANIAPAE
jgi:predicted DNA-binding transcriptional regulator AlpA